VMNKSNDLENKISVKVSAYTVYNNTTHDLLTFNELSDKLS